MNRSPRPKRARTGVPIGARELARDPASCAAWENVGASLLAGFAAGFGLLVLVSVHADPCRVVPVDRAPESHAAGDRRSDRGRR